MPHAVRCPSCQNLSRVEDFDLDRSVACPHCGRPFTAVVDRPIARPVRPITPPQPVRPPPPEDILFLGSPVSDEEFHPDPPPPIREGLTTTLIGLALLAWVIPFFWLAAPILTGKEPIFTLAVPVAMAIALTGLGLGIGAAAKWSHSTRIKGIVMLILIGYGTASTLYFLKKEWVEAVRRTFGRGELEWREFHAGTPPAYKVRFPGEATKSDSSPLNGWKLEAYRFTDDRPGASDAFVSAHGNPPPELAQKADDDWFAAVKRELDAEGEVRSEREISQQNDVIGREYVLGLPDGATSRVVRVFRRGPNAAYYLAAEGAFFGPDAKDVRIFFDSFWVFKKK